jgi:hypothetical protein
MSKDLETAANQPKIPDELVGKWEVSDYAVGSTTAYTFFEDGRYEYAGVLSLDPFGMFSGVVAYHSGTITVRSSEIILHPKIGIRRKKKDAGEQEEVIEPLQREKMLTWRIEKDKYVGDLILILADKYREYKFYAASGQRG